jgi:hypothetical protein
MRTINLQTIKSKGAKAIPDDQVVWLIVNSKPKSVLVPPDQFEALVEAYEDLEDIKIYEERKGEDTIPFEEVFPLSRKTTTGPLRGVKRRASQKRAVNRTVRQAA